MISQEDEPVKSRFAELSKEIRKDSRSIKNRVASIVSDAEFVLQVGSFFSLPLIANERCGSWYIPPEKLEGSVYFKSTDGHTGQWGFNTRRLNLPLLDHIKANNGAIIVDSTRRGKLMPDSLSKTIPIWCAILNLALFDLDLFFTPPNMVSRSEHSQIHQLIHKWKEHLLDTQIDIDFLKSRIDLPIRPIWVTRDSNLDLDLNGQNRWSNPWAADYYPLVLCTSSKAVQDGTEYRNGYVYVQGAADDHELWAGHLMPLLMWKNRQLFSSSELTNDDIEKQIKALYEADNSSNKTMSSNSESTVISPTNISISQSLPEDAKTLQSLDAIIDMRQNSMTHGHDLTTLPYVYFPFPLPPGKRGSKILRLKLPSIVESIEQSGLIGAKILVCCDTGSDFSAGVALALLCLFYSNDYKALPKKSVSFMDKTYIRQRLVHMTMYRAINPSRMTLNSVNSYLMA